MAEAIQEAPGSLEANGAELGGPNQILERLWVEVAQSRISLSITERIQIGAYHQRHSFKTHTEP